MDIENKLNLLQEQCIKLADICQQKRRFSLDESDHFGFMSLIFLSKQNDHMSAILRLYPHPDIQLISRSMIEGLSQLLWCFKDPQRASQWRHFVWINDWRTLRKMTSEGREVPSDKISAIENAIQEHGEIFKKDKFRNKPLPDGKDPFHDNWRRGMSLKNITKEVEGDRLYDTVYSSQSDWHHWGVAALGQRIERVPGGVTYGKFENPHELYSSLAVAWQCLYQVMELNNSYHKLGMDNGLATLKKEYISAQENT